MKIKYKILYKNGIEDEIIQEGIEDELVKLNKTIEESFKEEVEVVLTLGDSVSVGYYIRLSDVSRVTVELL